MRVSGFGLGIDLPAGWDGRISLRQGDEGDASARAGLHAANFPLPELQGDYGAGAVEIMGRDDLFIALLEFDRASSEQALFQNPGPPLPLAPDDFSPAVLQRTIPGHAGAQAFFASNGRAFCLYVVLGRFVDRNRLVPLANGALATLTIDP